ncbi:MFS transporter [Sphingomonas sp. FW199]|uniref:MFS transporter n=1 Tax=Sphingomonas sp. FW199 TaxID=3400217 RepID=UPI003CF1C5FE
MTNAANPGWSSNRILKLLIFLMFAAFAMTTDSVGTVIPSIIREFQLGLTAAGSFHYATMSGIGISALFLGFLADRLGRKWTILIGLGLFGLSSAAFAVGHDFTLFVVLLFLSGLGIGIFKSAALALIGDITGSTREHASTMNLVEGFFGTGAIIGPAIVAYSIQQGASWKWVYLIAAMLCLVLIAGMVATPVRRHEVRAEAPASAGQSLALLRDPATWIIGVALMLYVGAEAAIYVWAPTYFTGYDGSLAVLAGYVVSIFFVLRAAGRFVGAWLLARHDWKRVIAICSTGMAALFVIALIGGRDVAVVALPATGIFMSVIYPTLNSTGISCFERDRHGSIAGLLLFFTCVSAVLAPLAMGVVGDLFGAEYTIVLGGLFAVALALLALWTLRRDPLGARLDARNQSIPSEAH